MLTSWRPRPRCVSWSRPTDLWVIPSLQPSLPCLLAHQEVGGSKPRVPQVRVDKVLQVLIASTPVVVGDGTATTALPEVASESNPVSFKGGESTLSFTGAVVTIAPKDEGGSASPLPSVTPDVRAADVM